MTKTDSIVDEESSRWRGSATEMKPSGRFGIARSELWSGLWSGLSLSLSFSISLWNASTHRPGLKGQDRSGDGHMVSLNCEGMRREGVAW